MYAGSMHAHDATVVSERYVEGSKPVPSYLQDRLHEVIPSHQ